MTDYPTPNLTATIWPVGAPAGIYGERGRLYRAIGFELRPGLRNIISAYAIQKSTELAAEEFGSEHVVTMFVSHNDEAFTRGIGGFGIRKGNKIVDHSDSVHNMKPVIENALRIVAPHCDIQFDYLDEPPGANGTPQTMTDR